MSLQPVLGLSYSGADAARFHDAICRALDIYASLRLLDSTQPLPPGVSVERDRAMLGGQLLV